MMVVESLSREAEFLFEYHQQKEIWQDKGHEGDELRKS